MAAMDKKMESCDVNPTQMKTRRQVRAIPMERNLVPMQWLVGIALLVAILIAAGAAHARGTPESFADLAEKLIPSVVTISSTQATPQRQGPEGFNVPPGSPFEEFFKDFFERNQPQQRRRRPTSLGSGFIIDKKGYVVTNNHVIADAEEITVVLHDDTMLKAELVGRDPETDLAVLKIDPDGQKLSVAEFGDSDGARVGDWVLAIGNPFGLGSTVTAGIISARGRDINAGRYDDFIQTDAPINKGNSGGPLFNKKGGVIGVNTMIYSPSGGSVGIGFSVPSAVAKPVISQLIDGGKVRRGWLGVRIQTVTEEIAESLDLKKATGALVASVSEGSPAADAGIKPRDVVLKFAGRKVTEMRKLPRIVAETPIDKAVDVVLWRDGKEKVVQVTVGELKEQEVAGADAGKGKDKKSKKTERLIEELGLTLSAISPEIAQRLELAEDAKGVVVTKVSPDSVAAEKGIRVGDLVVEVGQEEVSDPDQVAKKVKKAKKAKRKTVLLLVEGQSGLRFVALRLGSK